MHDNRAINAYRNLREEGYGRDTWMASKSGRAIAEKHFYGRLQFIEIVAAIERVSKSGKLKSVTGNTSTSIKGGANRQRGKKIGRLPSYIIKEIDNDIKFERSERMAFFRSDDFLRLCQKHSDYHPGEIIRCINNLCKRYRKNKTLVYFIRDPLRPNEYNVGRTDRTIEDRLNDAGSKGRHWERVAELEDVSENEVHKRIKKWKSFNGRGSETFILDNEAQEIIFRYYGIWLPIE